MTLGKKKKKGGGERKFLEWNKNENMTYHLKKKIKTKQGLELDLPISEKRFDLT